MISADEVGVYKPSPAVYRLAPRKLGLARTAVGFVSANCFDVIGARAFGLWTCWVNRSGATVDELGVSPNATVGLLTDLVDVVKL